MFGVGDGDGDGDGILGAATMTLPDESEPSPDIVAFADETWANLGPDARGRYEEYIEATKTSSSPAPHHYLNMIGVRTSSACKGRPRCWGPGPLRCTTSTPGSHASSGPAEADLRSAPHR